MKILVNAIGIILLIGYTIVCAGILLMLLSLPPFSPLKNHYVFASVWALLALAAIFRVCQTQIKKPSS